MAENQIERLPALAEEVVRLQPAVIVAGAVDAALAAKKVTSTIPIVSAALADADHLGLVASYSRPGGNVTGITPYIAGLPAKQIELAREIVPGAGKIGLLANLNDPKAPPQRDELKNAAGALGATVIVPEVKGPNDVAAQMQEALVSERIDVVIVLQTTMLLSLRRQIATLMATNRLPTVYGYREHVDEGGLISYGVNLRWCWHRLATYVHKILNGAAPGELPVEFPPRLQMVVNVRAAKALGITVPPLLLARADEVIEMKRRQFITLLSGATLAWPLSARAQQPAMPVMGFLDTSTLAQTTHFLVAFRQGLLEEGFVEGRNVKVEYKWGENQNDRLPALAADLAQLQVAVIFAGNLPSALAAQRATKTVPIVFGIGGDPVALGLVASLNHPGGNITGITLQSIEAYAKRVELLHELIPAARSIAFLTNPTNKRNAEDETSEAQRAGGALGLNILRLDASSPSDVEAAFAALARERAGALLVSADPFFVVQRHQLIDLAARHAVPAAYARREFTADGGLMSYGASLPYAYHVMGAYSGKILKGAKPADLPVVQPTKFDLAINLKSAKALGLTVPPTLLARADEIIE